jgi:hypothetical protein
MENGTIISGKGTIIGKTHGGLIIIQDERGQVTMMEANQVNNK